MAAPAGSHPDPRSRPGWPLGGPRPAAEPGELVGRRVVVCRSEADAGPLVEGVQRLGAEALMVPLLDRAGPADGGAALRHALDRIDRYQWLAVTSAAGAEAVVDALAGRPLPPSLRVAAVGPATAAAFEQAGVAVHLVPPSATAAALAAVFPPVTPTPAPVSASGPAVSGPVSVPARAGPAPGPASLPVSVPVRVGPVSVAVAVGTMSGIAEPQGPEGERPAVLAPLAELAGDDLVAGLEARGYRVDRVEAYRLVDPAPGSAPDRSQVTAADAVLFTSPSIVDRFLDRFGADAVPPVAICIGPRTADRARLRGVPAPVIATPHSVPGLLAALAVALAC